jgi:hypothetical protein
VHEDDAAYDPVTTPTQPSPDPAFGIWRDRDDMTDIEAYLRKLRAPSYSRDGTRSGG